MIRKVVRYFFCFLVMNVYAESHTQVQLEEQAQVITHRLMSQLKLQLKSAMQASGPVAAIHVCATQAPLIIAELSEETGWAIKRVSLQMRNEKTADPDAWEEQVLRYFDEHKGEQSLSFSAVEEQTYRYMHAQKVAPLCLTCHGQNISADVREALDTLYPNDQAIGYKLGDIRGAISLSKSID